MADSSTNKDVVLHFLTDVFVNHDMTRLDEYVRETTSSTIPTVRRVRPAL